MPAAFAQDDESGQDLPRFVSTRSQPINVRVGPGTRYDVAWEFKKAGLPVEIIQEFDVWRKIRYYDGEEGWIHQSLLSSHRSALARPWDAGGQIAVLAQPQEGSAVRARLEAGFLVDIESCQKGWCEVKASGKDQDGNAHSYTGYVVQFDLWGVYPDEVID